MSLRRGATDLAGVIPVDKPSGITSHDVVDAMRKATGERRIGHTGTLDPMATGLMLLLVGRATRLERYLVGHDKRYEATIRLGIATDTLDAQGAVVDEMPVAPEMFDAGAAQALLRAFLGQHDQMPPAYSAIKRNGVPAYRLARAGEEPDLEPRAVEISEAVVRSVDAEANTIDAVFTVSSGTYVRALARDIGVAGGTLAHLAALRRTRIGEAAIAQARPLREAVRLAEQGAIAELFIDPLPLLDMPALAVDPAAVRDGRPVACVDDSLREGASVALTDDHSLLAIYRREKELLLPETVFAPGIPR